MNVDEVKSIVDLHNNTLVHEGHIRWSDLSALGILRFLDVEGPEDCGEVHEQGLVGNILS